MKILIIAPSTLPIPAVEGGAIETLITYVLKENEKFQLLDIDVITPYHKKLCTEKANYKKCNLIVYRPSKKKIISILDFMRKVIYKISFYHFIYYDQMSLFIKKYLKVHGNEYEKIIFEGNAMQLFCSPKTKEKNILHIHTDIFNLEFRFAYKVASKVGKFWAVSDYIKQRIEDATITSVPVKVIRNCADLDVFNYDRIQAGEVNSLKCKYGIKDTDFVVLFTGRFDVSKGVKELVQACVELDTNNLKVLIAGGFNYSNNVETAYIKEVKDIAKEKKDRFIFTGYVEHEKMPLLFALATIVVIPSKCNEAASLSLIEARTMGCPVIATKKGGIPEYIGKGGILLTDGENLIEELKNAIYELYTNEEYREKLRRINLIDRHKFSVENYYKNFVFELLGK